MTHSLQIRSEHHVRNATWTLLSLWFVLALIGSLAGIFHRPGPPIALGLMAGMPVILFVIASLSSDQFREFVMRANPRVLTLAQTWRAIGLVFVILYYRGLLPAAFALPAGYGDVAIGITAPLVAWAMGSAKPPRRLLLAIWNLLGIADLVTAVTLGVLSSQSPIGILGSPGATTQLMGYFPLSLIPTFLVPLFLIFHLITLARLREGRSGIPTTQSA